MGNSFENDLTEMLILHAAGEGDASGYDIARQVLERSRGHFELLEGDLYPLLHRLERQGLLDAWWTTVAEDRRRKLYRITAQGQMLLEKRRAQWRAFSEGVDGALGAPRRADLLNLAGMIF